MTVPTQPLPARISPPKRGLLARWALQEDLNFLLTNRLPRRLATVWMGRFSRIRSPLLTSLAIRVWRRFSPDLDFSDSPPERYKSLRDCFIRELRPGVRPIDPRPDVAVSPCDAIVGAFGRLEGTRALQIKGMSYQLEDLLPRADLARQHEDGVFVTLRLRSSMYHHFHAPADCRLRRVTHLWGDTWNVNPIALRRVERLFCRNERALLELDLPCPEQALSLVPVAAILVAGIRLRALPDLDLRARGREPLPVDRPYVRGEPMGHFEHGSTILVFASGGFELHPDLTEGKPIRMGMPLLTGLRQSSGHPPAAAPRCAAPTGPSHD